ncbi:MAG: PLP-dependent aminotransferase family protein [Candidatus Competibacterales bacterium]|nr:PLP-dependent aminotransferase family protein [Candidatus Competibacterales bacterium]
MRDQLFHLCRDNTTSLQSQLRECLVRAILDGHIPGGDPVPSCRRLAQQLGVARNTVVLAYQQLVDQGYLTARERSGYYVNPGILDGRANPPRRRTPDPEPEPGPDWPRRFTVRASALRSLAKPPDWHRYPYPFIYGQSDPTLFPIADWRECSRQALSIRAIHAWTRDRVDADDPLLLEQIHTRLLPRRGVWADPQEILVTNGAQQALYLLAHLLLCPQSRVGIEDPGYPDARNIFALHTDRLQALPVDAGGLQVEDAPLERCDYVYVTPSHQSPTTVTLALERRERLLQRARQHDFVLFEDDYESETNYAGDPIPALKSLDNSDRVLYLGSLSKTLAPGLRLGFLVGPAPLIREARALRRLMLRHPPSNNQRAVALFLALGHHDSLVQRLRNAYRERWEVLGRALARHLPQAVATPTSGGTSFWVRGPCGLDSLALARAAAERGVLIEPGDVHFLADEPPRHYFRLGFSSIPVERIEPGIRQLAGLFQQLTAA